MVPGIIQLTEIDAILFIMFQQWVNEHWINDDFFIRCLYTGKQVKDKQAKIINITIYKVLVPYSYILYELINEYIYLVIMFRNIYINCRQKYVRSLYGHIY